MIAAPDAGVLADNETGHEVGEIEAALCPPSMMPPPQALNAGSQAGVACLDRLVPRLLLLVLSPLSEAQAPIGTGSSCTAVRGTTDLETSLTLQPTVLAAGAGALLGKRNCPHLQAVGN